MTQTDDKLYEQLGTQIRALRDSRFTQAELAQLAGVERTSITNIENGNQKIPLHLLYRVCSILSVDPRDILPPPEVFLKNKGMENVEIGGARHDLPPIAANVIHRIVGN